MVRPSIPVCHKNRNRNQKEKKPPKTDKAKKRQEKEIEQHHDDIERQLVPHKFDDSLSGMSPITANRDPEPTPTEPLAPSRSYKKAKKKDE